MAFIGAVLPLIYVVVFAVIGVIEVPTTFSEDLKTLVVTSVVSGMAGAISGYAVGSSNGSARKDEKPNGVNG